VGLAGITGISNYRKRAEVPQVAEAINALGIDSYKGSYGQNVAIERYLKEHGLLRNGALTKREEPLRLIEPSRGDYSINMPLREPEATASVGDPSLWAKKQEDELLKNSLLASTDLFAGAVPKPYPMRQDKVRVRLPEIEMPARERWIEADADKYPYMKLYRDTVGTLETKQNRKWEGPKADTFWQQIHAAGCKPGDAYCNYTLRAAAKSGIDGIKDERTRAAMQGIINAARGNTVRAYAYFKSHPELFKVLDMPVPGAIALAISEDALDNRGNVKMRGWYPGHTFVVDRINPETGEYESIEGNAITDDKGDIIDTEGFGPDEGYKEGVVRRRWTPDAVKKYQKEHKRIIKYIIPNGI